MFKWFNKKQTDPEEELNKAVVQETTQRYYVIDYVFPCEHYSGVERKLSNKEEIDLVPFNCLRCGITNEKRVAIKHEDKVHSPYYIGLSIPEIKKVKDVKKYNWKIITDKHTNNKKFLEDKDITFTWRR